MTFRGVISNQVPTADFDCGDGLESSQLEASIGKPVLVPYSRQLSPKEQEDSDSCPDVVALRIANGGQARRNEVAMSDSDSNDLEPMVSLPAEDYQNNSVEVVN